MGRSKPANPLLARLLGQAPRIAFPSGVPNCLTCHKPRVEVSRSDISDEIWNQQLAPMAQRLQEAGESPSQITYCKHCNEYGLLGGWNSF